MNFIWRDRLQHPLEALVRCALARSASVISTKALEVLVVEDEPLVRMLLVDALVEEGYEVHQAGNAVEALAILNRSFSIDALITDVVMPGDLTGLDLANWVNEHRPDTLVLVTSGYVVDAQARLASTKFSKFIQKPYKPDAVISELRTSLNES